MRLGIIALLVTLASGCVPIAETTKRTTSRTLGKLVIDQPGPIELQVDREERTVTVFAQRNYRCQREVVDQIEAVTSTKARMVGTSDGEGWGWLLLVPMGIVYPVGALDLVLANAVAVLTPDRTTRDHSVAGKLGSDCQAPARTRIYVTLASGQEMQSLTDEAGVAAFVLPLGEDPRTVVVRGDQAGAPPPAASEPAEEEIADGVFITPNETPSVPEPTATRTPATPPPPTPVATRPRTTSIGGFGGVSRVIRECGAEHHTTGTVTVTLIIDAGDITSVSLDRHDQGFAACVRARVVAVAFESTRTGTIRVPFKIDAR